MKKLNDEDQAVIDNHADGILEAEYNRGVQDGIKLGVDTMCGIRDLMLTRIRDLVNSGSPELALALINDILN